MEKNVLRHLGDKPLGSITVSEWAAVLKPIWNRPIGYKTAVALNAIYERAIRIDTHKTRLPYGNPIPATMHDALDKISPADRDQDEEQHPALPVEQIPALYALCAAQPITCRPAKALQLLLLCSAPRAAEINKLRWREVIWQPSDSLPARLEIPANRIKGKHDHWIPLSAPALALLRELKAATIRNAPDDFVFQGRSGKWINFEGSSRNRIGGTWVPFSGAMQEDAMRDWFQANMPVEIDGRLCNVHGLRGSYLTWCSPNLDNLHYKAADYGLDHVDKEKTQIQRIYDKYKYAVERQTVLLKWTSHLLSDGSAARAAA